MATLKTGAYNSNNLNGRRQMGGALKRVCVCVCTGFAATGDIQALAGAGSQEHRLLRARVFVNRGIACWNTMKNGQVIRGHGSEVHQSKVDLSRFSSTYFCYLNYAIKLRYMESKYI